MNQGQKIRIILWLMIPFLMSLASCNAEIKEGESSNIENNITVKPIKGPLLAHYTFDGPSGMIATDSSANELDGKIYNAVRTAGKLGNALLFNSSAARVEIPPQQDIYWVRGVDAFKSGNISIDAWISLNLVETGKTYQIVGSSLDQGFRFEVNNQVLEFLLYDGSSMSSVVMGNTILPQSTWTYITVTYDGTTAKLYLNAIEDNSAIISITFDYLFAYETEKIGAFGWVSNTNNFPGIIDEVRIFDIALTQTEITDYYNATK